MASAGSESSEREEIGEGGRVIISADRTPEEHEEAYSVEWREPANSLSFADRIRRLF